MRGRRVTLRPVLPEEATLIHQWNQTVVQDSAAQASISGDLTAATESIREALLAKTRNTLMILAPTGEPIGLVEWAWIGGPRVRTADIGVTIGVPQLWNLGHGADAIDTLIAHLFLQENAHRVQFAVSLSNARMVSSLARPGGPVLEGVRREAGYLDGRHEDLLLFGILRREFDQVLPQAPDLKKRVAGREQLHRDGRLQMRRHLTNTEDSSVHHMMAAVTEPIMEELNRL